jgi:hypothetical protein
MRQLRGTVLGEIVGQTEAEGSELKKLGDV